MEKGKLQKLKLLSAKIRKDILEMLEKRGYGHMGGSLSIVELMSVLYGKQLRYDAKNPDWEFAFYLIESISLFGYFGC